MSKEINRLSPLQIRTLKEPGFYHDGAGLYLQISRFGTKSWVLRYTLNKRRRDMGLGPLTNWTLAEARERARQYRKLVDDSIDPIVMREAQAEQQRVLAARKLKESRTFAECALEYHEANKSDWKNEKHAAQWINTLTTYAFPKFGTKPIGQIGKDEIRAVLLPIWKSKAETASRVLQRIRTVINYAAAIGYCDGLDSEQWTQLREALPRNSKEREVEHHASCPSELVGGVIQRVRNGPSMARVKLAFEFIVLTASRSGETRGACWSEIDFTNRCWSIPKERMKAGRPHTIPLSDAAWAIIKKAKSMALDTNMPEGLIFPSAKGTAFSDMTFTQLLRRMKEPYTMHGFRASFRTWGAERGDYEHEILEIALSHIVGDETVRAYQRSDMLERRRKLMQDWADYLSTNPMTIAVIGVR